MPKVKIQKIKDVTLPNYAHEGDAGLDFYSAEENYTLKPGERKLFATGIKMEIPEGYVGLFWDKSGLALKYGIKTMGGVIDSTYRGEIAVILINFSDNNFTVEKNTKIAQMLIQKIENPHIITVENVSDSKRGENGFGSTGSR